MTEDTFNWIMLVVSAIGTLAWAVWPKVRESRRFKRELNEAFEQIDRGIRTGDDAEFRAGLKRLDDLQEGNR
jgi:Flp pilus assembly protein TadB